MTTTQTEALLALVLAADEYEGVYASRGECEAIARREVIAEFGITEEILTAWEAEALAV